MRDFEEFRSIVLTDKEISEITRLAKESADQVGDTDSKDWIASFSATFSLHLLCDYHEWLHQD